MNDRRENVDHTLEAVARLRRLVAEHDRSGAADTPFVLGIREALAERDAYESAGESSAA